MYVNTESTDEADARAVNKGTISTSGTAATGIRAQTGVGSATAINTGTITVSGASAGVQAITFGSGIASVSVADGGKVTASHDDGIGIYASSGAAGSVDVVVRNGAVIDAAQAVLLEGAPALLTLWGATIKGRVSLGNADDFFVIDDSVLRGDVAMGGGDDFMAVASAAVIEGDIDFGDGEDTLELDVDGASRLSGTLSNLEYLNKACPGDFTIDGDVSFTGSSVRVMEGGLVVTGHMDLGADGSVEVHDGTRLTGLLTAGGTPRITAGSTTVQEGGAVALQRTEDAGDDTDAAAAVQTFLEGANVQGDGPLSVQTTTGEDDSLTELASFDPATNEATPAEGDVVVGARADEDFLSEDELTVDEDDSTVLPTPPEPTPTTPPTAEPDAGGGSGGGSGGGALVGLGLLGLLFSLMDFGLDDEAAPALAAPKPAFVRSADGDSRWWTRSLSGPLPTGGASGGVEIGMDLGVGNGFSLGFAAAPEMTAQRSAGAESTALSGGRYSLRGGWRGESLFAGLSFTHADWRVQGSWENPTVGSLQRSRFDAAQQDLRLRLGARLALGGGVTLTPQAEAFAGELEHGGHMADGAVFRAAMPGVTQRYSGVKAGLGLASGWRETGGGVKLRPALNLSAMRTRTASGSFEMKQSDRLGILSTSSRARLADGPATVLGLGAGLEAAGPGGLQLGFGYAGLVVDGEVVHAAAARLRLPF